MRRNEVSCHDEGQNRDRLTINAERSSNASLTRSCEGAIICSQSFNTLRCSRRGRVSSKVMHATATRTSLWILTAFLSSHSSPFALDNRSTTCDCSAYSFLYRSTSFAKLYSMTKKQNDGVSMGLFTISEIMADEGVFDLPFEGAGLDGQLAGYLLD
jgi:hypothetical protein